MSLLRGVQRLARVALGGAGAAARGRLIPLLPRSCLAALRSRLRFSSAYPTTAARSRFAIYSSAGWVICGGIHDEPGREMDPEAIELARFAVAEHNSKTNAALEFVRLVKVRTQVVAGYMYYFTIEVRQVDGMTNKLYEAKVWLRPWEKFKGLDTFEPVANADEGEGKTKV